MSYIPAPDRPKAVPAIRDNLISICRMVWDNGGPFGQTMVRWEMNTLQSDDLRMVWVSEDMVGLTVDTAPSIPHDIMLDELNRIPCGLAVFAHPIEAIDAIDHTKSLTVEGLLWGPIRIQRKDGTARYGVSIAALARIVDGTKFADGWFPLGRSEWMEDENLETMDRTGTEDIRWGKDTSERWVPVLRTDTPPDEDDMMAKAEHTFDDHSKLSYYKSAIEDRVLLATLSGLMTQTRTTEVGTWRPHNKAARRRYGDVEVATVTLRAAERTDGRHTGTGTKLDHRTYVAPYFRMQAHGPGRSLRRLQLIDGHIRGPEGAPLVRRTKVWRLSK
jgi:hypothetical protein